MAGSSSEARDCWAAWRVVCGVSSKWRVLLRTVFRRGKSEIPESRIEMDESRREREERSDVTEAFNDWEDGVVILIVDCF